MQTPSGTTIVNWIIELFVERPGVKVDRMVKWLLFNYIVFIVNAWDMWWKHHLVPSEYLQNSVELSYLRINAKHLWILQPFWIVPKLQYQLYNIPHIPHYKSPEARPFELSNTFLLIGFAEFYSIPMPANKTSLERCNAIISLWNKGHSSHQIASMLNISPCTVDKIHKEHCPVFEL